MNLKVRHIEITANMKQIILGTNRNLPQMTRDILVINLPLFCEKKSYRISGRLVVFVFRSFFVLCGNMIVFGDLLFRAEAI